MAAKRGKPELPQAVAEKVREWEAEQAWQSDTDADDDDFEQPSAVSGDNDADPAVVEFCAEFDTSDTDNGKRMKLHFGEDLMVLAQEKAKAPLFAVWTGTHWDVANGGPKALAIAQRLGDRIALEAGFIKPNRFEQMWIDKGLDALAKAQNERSDEDRNAIAYAEKAKISHGKRVKKRLDHAVSSKNVAKMRAALDCLAPHIIKSPDAFNADKMMLATQNATLKFHRKLVRRRNDRHVSPEATPDAPEFIEVCTDSRLEVIEGHRRQDLITQVMPVRYDPKATCPRWMTFLTGKLPDAQVRRLVQVSSGLGMLGITVQYLFFHYGNGANGKSVYMETICRVLGELSVTLPATSLIGEGGASGSASPDLARLFGRKLLRVKELPEGEDLRENLVKELTGGETVVARDLFAGYMEFQPIFIAIMSGNGYPRITGTDEGIWRRMAVIHWPVKVAKEDRREFEDMMTTFEPEYAGILNWLIEGVHIFLREGLVIPKAVEDATQEYRDTMDPTAGFVGRCIRKDDNAEPVQGRDLFSAYVDDTTDQGGKPMSLTAFGRIMGKKFRKERAETGVVYYGFRIIRPDRRDSDPPDHGAPPHEEWPEP